MPVILLSADSFNTGHSIAAATAERLGYRLIEREILTRVANERGITESKLCEALERSIKFLGISNTVRQKYLAFIQAAVIAELVGEEVVCHGLAAHLFVRGVSHVLKVRILAEHEAMAQEIAIANGMTIAKARKAVARAATAGRHWSKTTFAIDETDPTLYDLAIKVSQIEPSRAVEIIVDTAMDDAFKPNTYSRKRVNDLVLESRARAALIDRFPDVKIQGRDGQLVVQVVSLRREQPKKEALVKKLLTGMPEIEHLEVRAVDDTIGRAAESLR